MSKIDYHAQYQSKFSRLWERYDEASHGNAEQMRDILEVTLDALESAEMQILKLEKLVDAESIGADKAAASCVEWMKRCHAAEKRIAELEAREVVPDEITPKQASRSYCGEVRGYRDGWNACRSAMLQDSKPVTDNTNQQFESLSRGGK